MKEFEFTVNAKAKGKERPRIVRKNGVVRAYTPIKTLEFERLVASEFLSQGGTVFDHKWLSVTITAYFPIPKSTKKADRLQLETGYVPYDKKPDTDNIAKSILDGLNKIAWLDDKQVVNLKVKKFYGTVPKLVIKIREVYANDN